MMSSGLSARPAPGTARAGHLSGSVQRRDRTGALVLVIVLAAAGVESARLGAAHVFADSGSLDVERLISAPRLPAIQDLSRAAGYFADSLRYAPGNPRALEGLGATDFVKMRAAATPQQAVAAMRDAQMHFRQALQQRPTSPFLWANLALAKLNLDEIDAELFAALRYANELGPWEPAVQQTALFVALAAWHGLDAGLRQAVATMIKRGALRNAQAMFEIVQSFGRYDLVCGVEKYASIAGAKCGHASEFAAPAGSIKKGRRQ